MNKMVNSYVENQIPLVDKENLLANSKGKGGWTFAKIPEITQNKKTSFGWLSVRGKIDHFEIKNYNSQPIKLEL